MKHEYETLEPCFIGPVKIKALSSADEGEGWSSPCPQVYLNIGKVGAGIIGYENVKKLRDMCNHALSAGPWDTSPPVSTTKPCTPYTHKWIDINNDRTICTKCLIFGTKYKKLLLEEWYNKHLAKIIANIIINDLLKHSNKKNCKVNDLGLSSYDIWWLSNLIFYDVLDRTKVTKIIDHFIEFNEEIKEIITKLNLWPTWDNKLEEMINKVLQDNPKIVEQILGGKEKALGSLIGKLKQIDKDIDSKEAITLLKEKINV